jgi:hypothetical protein
MQQPIRNQVNSPEQAYQRVNSTRHSSIGQPQPQIQIEYKSPHAHLPQQQTINHQYQIPTLASRNEGNVQKYAEGDPPPLAPRQNLSQLTIQSPHQQAPSQDMPLNPPVQTQIPQHFALSHQHHQIISRSHVEAQPH